MRYDPAACQPDTYVSPFLFAKGRKIIASQLVSPIRK
jgi:hypothetical protein